VFIHNRLTNQTGVVSNTFGENRRGFGRHPRARGATPIIASLTPRKYWKDGRIAPTRGSFADWAAETPRAEGVPFVDLTELASLELDTMPPARVDSLYGDANLHTSARGAELFARTIVEGLEALGEDNPLKGYVVEALQPPRPPGSSE
jgi:lysophospholipase L1-like esterase